MHAESAGSFTSRCRITGVLTTRSPLHVGSGEMLYLHKRTGQPPVLNDDDPRPKYNAFVEGVDGAAPVVLIPGSTLKGVLRSWLRRRADVPASLINRVFGFEERDTTKGQGGIVEFHDVPLRTKAHGDHMERWWDGARGTCLASGVALDPRRRTALDERLYYVEYVPEGSTFQVTITGQNLNTAERNLLCAALAQGFADDDLDAICIGAGVANDWGRMAWTQTECAVIEPSDVKTWLVATLPRPYESLFRAIPTPVTELPLKPISATLRLEVHLRFTGAVLVNDPSQEEKRNKDAGIEGTTHAAVRRVDGSYYLPGSSVRGALRAQARRIWQTLAYAQGGYLPGVDAPEAKRQGSEKGLNPFYRMLGAPGWRAPVRVPDFIPVGDVQKHEQEFVAIDRFTGSAAERKKFNAKALYAPEFTGIVDIDLARWHHVNVGGWGLLLLLYLLRDLQEGDIQFGFGRSKGYGACTAEITPSYAGPVLKGLYDGDLAALVTGVLSRDPGTLQSAVLQTWDTQLMQQLAAGSTSAPAEA